MFPAKVVIVAAAKLELLIVLIDTRTNAVLNTRNWLVQGPPAVAAVAPPHKKYKWFDPRRWLGAIGVKQFK